MKSIFFTTLLTIGIFFLPYNSVAQDFIKVGATSDFMQLPLIYSMAQGLPLYFENFETTADCVAALKSGDIDATIMATDAALVLYEASHKKIVFLCVTQTADYYCVSKSAKTLADMVGREIILQNDTFAKGYFSWILSKSDIPIGTNQNSVHLSPSTLPQAMLLNKISNGDSTLILTEPARSALLKTADAPLYTIDLQDHYLNITGYSFMLPKYLLVARADFIKNDTAVNTLMESVRASITLVNSNVSNAARAAKTQGLAVNDAVTAAAIARANFIYTTAKESKASVAHYITLYNSAVTDKRDMLALPKSDFYGY